jgi:hypothetical protein
MKRIFGVIVVVVVILIAGGCGDKQEPVPQPKTPPPYQQ